MESVLSRGRLIPEDFVDGRFARSRPSSRVNQIRGWTGTGNARIVGSAKHEKERERERERERSVH